MFETVCRCQLSVSITIRAVHGLQEEVPEGKRRVTFWLRSILRVDELQLVSRLLHQLRTSFGAHAYPVDSACGRHRAIRLDGHFETGPMQGVDQRLIQL